MAAQPAVVVQMIDAHIQGFVADAIFGSQKIQDHPAIVRINPNAVLQTMEAQVFQGVSQAIAQVFAFFRNVESQNVPFPIPATLGFQLFPSQLISQEFDPSPLSQRNADAGCGLFVNGPAFGIQGFKGATTRRVGIPFACQGTQQKQHARAKRPNDQDSGKAGGQEDLFLKPAPFVVRHMDCDRSENYKVIKLTLSRQFDYIRKTNNERSAVV